MKVQQLSHDEQSEAVSVQVAAFHDYPVMRYILKTAGQEYESQLRTVMDFYCQARFAKEGLVLGIRSAGSLVAVGLVDRTSHKPWDQLKAELMRLKSIIGESAFARLERYETLSAATQPQVSHYYLGIIAVHPENQAKGCGRAILDHIRELSAKDPSSTGVCLATELPGNVSLYQHFGYRIIAETDIDELHSWCMFLPT
jgi:GNAT superfamily N-acetyltransferase